MTLQDVQAQIVVLDQDAQLLTADVAATAQASQAVSAAQVTLQAKTQQQAGDATKLDAQLASVQALLAQYASQTVIQNASTSTS